MTIVEKLYEAAKPYHPCNLFKGTETLDELLQVLLTPQGWEFCIKYDFPGNEQLGLLKTYINEDMDIYIDAGHKSLRNHKLVILAGDCDFRLEYDTLEHPCRVVLLKGARARIRANGYAVVAVNAAEGCTYSKNIHDHAIIR